MAYPGHPHYLSDNSSSFPNTSSTTTETCHPSQNASVSQSVQQLPSRTYNRSRELYRPGGSAGGNNGCHIRAPYGTPVIHYTRSTNLGFQPNTADPPNQQSSLQSPTGFPHHRHQYVSAGQSQEGPRNQGSDIAQRFGGGQEYDTTLANLTAFPGSYEQQPQFLHEVPSDPQNSANLKLQEKDIQRKREKEPRQGREEKKIAKPSHNKQELTAIGGACLFCRRSKKDCDLNLNCEGCQKRDLDCIRGFDTLSLYGINFDSPDCMAITEEARQTTIKNVKRAFSDNPDRLIRKLISKASPYPWDPEAILEFPDSSFILLDTSWANNFSGIDALPDAWQESLLEKMPAPQFPHFPDLNCSPILQSAATMLQVLALIISIARANLYARQGDIFRVRTTLVFILGKLRNALAEESERLLSKLAPLQKRGTRTPYDVWLAVAVHLNVIGGLFGFKPPSLVAEMFSDMKNCLVKVRKALQDILKETYGKLDLPPDITTKPKDWETSFKQVASPQVNPQSLDVKFYFKSNVPAEFAQATPIELMEHFSPCNLPSTPVSKLLRIDFDPNDTMTAVDPSWYMQYGGNCFMRTFPWAHQHLEQSTGADRDLSIEVEPDCPRISNQGTEVSDGEDSTLAGRSEDDAEENSATMPPSMSTSFDLTSRNSDLGGWFGDFPTYDAYLDFYKSKEPAGDSLGHRRNLSRGSSSSCQSRQNRNKQLRTEGDDCLQDLHKFSHPIV